jgi:hypothetical protein
VSGPVTTSANTYDEILPLEYQKCLVGLDAILSKTWDIANSGHVLYPSSEWVTSFGPIPEYVLPEGMRQTIAEFNGNKTKRYEYLSVGPYKSFL